MAQIFNIHGGTECASGQKQIEMEIAKLVIDAQALFFLTREDPHYFAQMANLIYFAQQWLSLTLAEIEYSCKTITPPFDKLNG